MEVSTDGGETWEIFDSISSGNGYHMRTYDLTSFVGNVIILRFRYSTAELWSFWYIDDVEIPEIGFYDDVEAGMGDWISNGWIIKEQNGVIEHVELKFDVDSSGNLHMPPFIRVEIPQHQIHVAFIHGIKFIHLLNV